MNSINNISNINNVSQLTRPSSTTKNKINEMYNMGFSQQDRYPEVNKFSNISQTPINNRSILEKNNSKDKYNRPLSIQGKRNNDYKYSSSYNQLLQSADEYQNNKKEVTHQRYYPVNNSKHQTSSYIYDRPVIKYDLKEKRPQNNQNSESFKRYTPSFMNNNGVYHGHSKSNNTEGFFGLKNQNDYFNSSSGMSGIRGFKK